MGRCPTPQPYTIIYGASPHALTENHYIWGFAPCPNRGGVYPTSRAYFGKKIPKNPKKPNRIRYRLSSIDSEQGCRRQPCFYVRRTRCGTATAPPHLPAIPPTFAAPALLRAHIAHALATLPASLTRSESVCLLRRRLFAAPHTRLPFIPQYSRAVRHRTISPRPSPRRSFEIANS